MRPSISASVFTTVRSRGYQTQTPRLRRFEVGKRTLPGYPTMIGHLSSMIVSAQRNIAAVIDYMSGFTAWPWVKQTLQMLNQIRFHHTVNAQSQKQATER